MATAQTEKLIARYKRDHSADLPPNRTVMIDSNTLEMVLRMNGVGLSLTGDLICDIRRALGENPNEPN